MEQTPNKEKTFMLHLSWDKNKFMNNLVRNSELTIWMVSILFPGFLAKLFQSSYHYHQLLLYIPKFSLASCTSTLLFLWWRKSWHHSCNYSASVGVLAPLPFSQKPVPFMAQLRLPTFLHLVLVRTDLELCLRRRLCGLSPVTRPARIYKSFQWTHRCQAEGLKDREKEERVESK